MTVVKFDSKVSWTVAVACACMNFLILIPTKVSGLFFVEILGRFGVSRNLAGYPTFTITLLRCSGGPLTGYFAALFGLNRVMILGSILAGLGLSASFFAENISTLTIFIGLIHGFGVAFNNMVLPQIVKIHFQKHLTLAFGITQAGACAGAFFTPPLLLWIFKHYGTSGGFLIIGAIVLNSLPIVMFLNILSPDRSSTEPRDSMKSKECVKDCLEMEITTKVSTESEDNNLEENTGNKEEKCLKGRKNDVFELQNCFENNVLASSDPDGQKSVGVEVESREKETSSETKMDGKQLCFDKCEIISKNKPKNTAGAKDVKEVTNNIDKSEKESNKGTAPFGDIRVEGMTKNSEEHVEHSNNYTNLTKKYKSKDEIITNIPLEYKKKDVLNCNHHIENIVNIPSYPSKSNMATCNLYIDSGKTQLQLRTETGEIVLPCPNSLHSKSSDALSQSFQESNHKEVVKTDKQPTTAASDAKKSFKIFLDITFWIVIITQSLHIFNVILFWTTMIDFSRDKNIDKSEEVYLLMILPIAEIIGRLCLGWIIDSNYLSRINFSIVSFIMLGCSCSFMAYARGLYAVLASIFAVGVISGGLVIVFPMIVFEFFDSTEHTMGQASRYCLFGPFSFLNGPLIGYFRDTLGSYSWLYHTMAIVSLTCGALSSLIPVLARIRDEKKNRR